MSPFATTSILALSHCLSVSVQLAPAQAASKVAGLRTAATANDRLNILNSDFVLHFLNASVTKGAGGQTTMRRLPSGILYAVNGSLQTGMLYENGARSVYNEIGPGSAAVFLKVRHMVVVFRAIIYNSLLSCRDLSIINSISIANLFISLLLSTTKTRIRDPALVNVGLPASVVAAFLGDVGVEEAAGLAIPNNITLGTDECLQKCNIPFVDQPTKQRQPRVSANALPSGLSRRTMLGSSMSPTPTNLARRAFSKAPERQHMVTTSSYPLSALLAVIALMAMGYAVIALAHTRRCDCATPPVSIRYEGTPLGNSTVGILVPVTHTSYGSLNCELRVFTTCHSNEMDYRSHMGEELETDSIRKLSDEREREITAEMLRKVFDASECDDLTIDDLSVMDS
ncbi:hypothetical protein BXZ70DRAFT_1004175 [Cristinia sonorae]|uniref:Uncharacterized protein n=1 Tax=Cristinia sonorae TaxID=1940300 RepID=A0A8K0UVN5_9AGAR|nr:hypothetical protein BXZ70DRAFT_1004175 [Cristinia sonorae]